MAAPLPVPTFIGFVATTVDAAFLTEAALVAGSLPHTNRRREGGFAGVAQSGAVYVHGGGVKRWKDQEHWSESRNLGNGFNVYRELATRPEDRMTAEELKLEKTNRATLTPYLHALVGLEGSKKGGLIKKAIKFELGGQEYGLTAYYTIADVAAGTLLRPRSTPVGNTLVAWGLNPAFWGQPKKAARTVVMADDGNNGAAAHGRSWYKSDRADPAAYQQSASAAAAFAAFLQAGPPAGPALAAVPVPAPAAAAPPQQQQAQQQPAVLLPAAADDDAAGDGFFNFVGNDDAAFAAPAESQVFGLGIPEGSEDALLAAGPSPATVATVATAGTSPAEPDLWDLGSFEVDASFAAFAANVGGLLDQDVVAGVAVGVAAAPAAAPALAAVAVGPVPAAAAAAGTGPAASQTPSPVGGFLATFSGGAAGDVVPARVAAPARFGGGDCFVAPPPPPLSVAVVAPPLSPLSAAVAAAADAAAAAAGVAFAAPDLFAFPAATTPANNNNNNNAAANAEFEAFAQHWRGATRAARELQDEEEDDALRHHVLAADEPAAAAAVAGAREDLFMGADGAVGNQGWEWGWEGNQGFEWEGNQGFEWEGNQGFEWEGNQEFEWEGDPVWMGRGIRG